MAVELGRGGLEEREVEAVLRCGGEACGGPEDEEVSTNSPPAAPPTAKVGGPGSRQRYEEHPSVDILAEEPASTSCRLQRGRAKETRRQRRRRRRRRRVGRGGRGGDKPEREWGLDLAR
ncbi:hypothetical protein OsI_02069 [Oryza sativa Indica Group]|uniref:Uncharacterized protein n=1 Tax=Oryza sativa subsp. indica TaxID=39946 RepID=A2WQE1_ORYSI|nr:hypothetical protein OsI_02069 [Oryza sativa Indica Group]